MTTIPFKGELSEYQINNIKIWIEALRSGQYEQCIGRLTVRGDAYCCLGVASVIKGCPLSDNISQIIYNDQEFVNFPPGEFMEKEYGFHWTEEVIHFTGSRETLDYLNDNGFSFSKIADVIQAVFIDRVEIEINEE